MVFKQQYSFSEGEKGYDLVEFRVVEVGWVVLFSVEQEVVELGFGWGFDSLLFVLGVLQGLHFFVFFGFFEHVPQDIVGSQFWPDYFEASQHPLEA